MGTASPTFTSNPDNGLAILGEFKGGHLRVFGINWGKGCCGDVWLIGNYCGGVGFYDWVYTRIGED